MIIRTMLTLALALAVTLPGAAQQHPGEHDTGTMATPPAATTVMPADTFREGAFVGRRAATAQLPETVTLRFDWQGTPVLGTFVVRRDDRWMTGGQPVNWADIDEGARVTVPQGARLLDMTFGGNVGVGTIRTINTAQQTVTVELPSGEMRTLRYMANPLVVMDGQIAMPTRLAAGQTVLFEIPPEGNQVALFTQVGPATRATVTQVTDEALTVRFTQDGREVTRVYPTNLDADFVHEGRPVVAENLPDAFEADQTVWIYGPTDNPRLIVSAPTVGFETAVVTGEQPEVAAAPTTIQVMEPPFNQGTFVSFTPATETMPALATFRFDWQGTPLLGTFIVTDESRFMSQGQQVNLAQLQEGAVVTVPQGVRLANLTFGGSVGIGTVSSIDRTRNTVTVRLPSGEMRTVRYSPQAIFLQEGRPATIAELETGQTVLFEVVPQRNMVGVFTPIGEGVRATVSQVTDEGITVRYTQDGQTVTRTFTSDEVAFVNQGRQVANVQTAYRVGQQVWIYGPADDPQLVAGGVQMGFETAMVTPAPPAVAGVREQPAAPARPVIRGRW